MIETSHLVSVIMSVYNSSMTVEDSIKSILNQSYSNIELLICNDASNDETQNILKIFEKKDSRVRLFKNSENLG